MGRHAEGWSLAPSKHRDSGILYVRFRHGGKQHFRSTGETDPGRAKEKAAAIYAEVVSGRRVLSTTDDGIQVLNRIALDAAFAEWLAEIEGTVDETTWDTYALYVTAHFVPFFRTLDRLAAGAQDYVRARLRQVLSKTVRKECSALRGALDIFVERGYLSRAPVIKSPGNKATGTPDKKRRHKDAPVILEPAEVAALLRQLPEVWRGVPLRARFIIAWETGLRPETLAVLKAPGDYTPGRKTLRVRAEADKARYARELPLTRRARETLDAVCPEVGTIFGRHTFKFSLRSAARRAGLPEDKASRLTAYDLRHSRATDLVAHSRNLAGVAFLLGHREITTLNKYVKPGQRAAEKVLAQAAMQGTNGGEEGPGEAAGDGADPAGFEVHLRTADGLADTDVRQGVAVIAGPPKGFPNKKGTLLEGARIVRKGRLELPRCCHHWNLNPARLPIPPLSQRPDR